MNDDTYTLVAKLDRFDDRFAVLSNDSMGQFRWPIKNLPENIKPGELVYLKVTNGMIEEEEKYARMRKLLEELIN